jgi:hypothetical protein
MSADAEDSLRAENTLRVAHHFRDSCRIDCLADQKHLDLDHC